MKFLLDVCASSRSMIAFLDEAGHDVLTADAAFPGAADERLLAVALAEGRILVTEDKDFGELAVLRRLPHGTLVRMVRMRVDDQVTAMRELLAQHEPALRSAAIVTITAGRIRIRSPRDK